ncbi:MAG: hypothetical protein J5629_12290 [Muribaculaceae bacterium]|nr:hypothetical protein [Muribaculaceae bacterium]
MDKITLKKINIQGKSVEYIFDVNRNLEKYFKTKVFFIQYEQELGDLPLSVLTIPFVNCMAGLSWLSGAMLFVDEIDENYYYSLKHIKSAYSELHRTKLNGVFVPSRLVKNVIKQSDECLLLFGGGVDCHSSYLRNREHISGVVNIYGWLDSIEQNNKIDEFDKKNTAIFAELFGISSYHIRSNFASQFNLSEIDKAYCTQLSTSYWYGFLHSMAFLSIATPLAWAKGISNIMIASSFTKGRANVHCGSYITTDSEYKFGTNGKTIHDGFELNRQEKVKILVDYQRVTNKPYIIQACSFNDHNCCECEKCFRTIIELVAENADPRDFGFEIEGSIKEHWKRIVFRDVGLWGISKENYYYNLSKLRMKENHDNINDKEFVDWFLNFDFNKAKKEGLRRYYRENFFSILKRKLKF